MKTKLFSLLFAVMAGAGMIQAETLYVTYGQESEPTQDYYSVSQIVDIYNQIALESGGESVYSYTVIGYVTNWVSGYPDYSNGRFYIDDTPIGSSVLYCYNLKANNSDDQRALSVGEKVEVTAHLKNYSGKMELANGTYHVIAEEQPSDPPSQDECVYESLNGQKDKDLLASLHTIIADHTVLDYNSVRGDVANVDFRSDGTLWDIYSDCGFYKSNYCNSNNYNTTVECECYNREHTVPVSWWGSSKDEPMYTDLHHIYSTDEVANSQRSAWPFGEVTSTPTWSNSLGSKVGYGTFGSSGNNYVFEPINEYKGDMARAYFYMITCYNDKNFTQGGKGYQVFTYSGGKSDFTSKALNVLLKWHRQDPVSDKERERNVKVRKLQNNDNPFVLAPDLVEYIWGNKKGVAYSCGDSPAEALDYTGAEQVSIDVLGNDVKISTCSATDIYIFDSLGRLVGNSLHCSQATISLNQGLYLVFANGKAHKVIISR